MQELYGNGSAMQGLRRTEATAGTVIIGMLLLRASAGIFRGGRLL